MLIVRKGGIIDEVKGAGAMHAATDKHGRSFLPARLPMSHNLIAQDPEKAAL